MSARRYLPKIVVACLILAVISPFIAGALAWAYVDEPNRTGIAYWVLYTMPFFLIHDLFGIESPTWPLMIGLYFSMYFLPSLVLMGAVKWIRRRRSDLRLRTDVTRQ